MVRSFREDQTAENGYRVETLVVGRNRLFWREEHGWTRADHLFDLNDDELELWDGSTVSVLCARPLYRTIGEDDVAWAESAWGGEIGYQTGHKVHMRSRPILVDLDSSDGFCTVVDDEDQMYRLRVFNLMVEGCHTYYVGEFGIRVSPHRYDSSAA